MRWIFILILFLPLTVQGINRIYSWTQPSVNASGKLIPIDHFNLYCSPNLSGPWKKMGTAVGTASSAIVPDCVVPPAFGYYAATAVGTNMQESDYSNIVTLYIDPAMPPTLCRPVVTTNALDVVSWLTTPGWVVTFSYCQ